MTTLHAEVFEAFRALDVPEEKALRAARALSDAFGRGDADSDAKAADGISALREEMRDGFRKVDTEFAKVRGEIRDGVSPMSMPGSPKSMAQFAKVDGQFAKVDAQFDTRFAKVEDRLDRINDGGNELRKEAAVTRWMLATVLALLTTLLVRVFLH